MTRRILATSSSGRAGFTLTEMLIVVGVIVILAGILLPTILRAWNRAERARMELVLQTVSTGLTEYRRVVGSLPDIVPPVTDSTYDPVYPTWTPDPPGQIVAPLGSRVLLDALIAPSDDDGKAGPGFRQMRGSSFHGPPVGPFLNPSNFVTTHSPYTGPGLFVQDFGPILYFRSYKTQRALTSADGYLSRFDARVATAAGRSMWNANDNLTAFMNQDTDSSTTAMNRARTAFRATITGAAQTQPPRFLGEYMLWACGSDMQFGTADDIYLVME